MLILEDPSSPARALGLPSRWRIGCWSQRRSEPIVARSVPPAWWVMLTYIRQWTLGHSPQEHWLCLSGGFLRLSALPHHLSQQGTITADCALLSMSCRTGPDGRHSTRVARNTEGGGCNKGTRNRAGGFWAFPHNDRVPDDFLDNQTGVATAGPAVL